MSLSGEDWAEVIDLEPVPEIAAEEETDLSAVLPRILKVLIAPPGPDQPLSYLEAVRFRNGRLIVVSGTATAVWRIPVRRAEIRRDQLGLKGVVELPNAQLGQWDALSFEVFYAADTRSTAVTAKMRNLHPDVIARLMPNADGALKPAGAFERRRPGRFPIRRPTAKGRSQSERPIRHARPARTCSRHPCQFLACRFQALGRRLRACAVSWRPRSGSVRKARQARWWLSTAS